MNSKMQEAAIYSLNVLVWGGRPPEKLLQRPLTCPLDGCHSSYRRKDHLTRHLLQHEGKLFECPTCKSRFAFQGSMKRHMREIHEETASSDIEDQKQHVCPEAGCGKVFKYASKLRKHEDSHVKLEALEVFCAEPGCLKYFTNEQCLKAHLQSCHQHITCEMCGTKQLKKNIKRHIHTHEKGIFSNRVKYSFKDCLHTFSTKSNLNQHTKAVHFEQKHFVCSIIFVPYRSEPAGTCHRSQTGTVHYTYCSGLNIGLYRLEPVVSLIFGLNRPRLLYRRDGGPSLKNNAAEVNRTLASGGSES